MPRSEPEVESSPGGAIRVQKALAAAGVGSRRHCDDLVASGRVRVNGLVASAGTKVDPSLDRVEVDGKQVALAVRQRVLLLHKPAGVVTTMDDERGRPCVGDMLRGFPERLFHVGRLDEDTEGLLLLTNDGDLAHLLMHPSHGVSKTYLARVDGRVTPGTLRRLRAGVELGDGPARADAVQVRASGENWTLLELVIHEGRKRIVRRLCRAVGHPVHRLTRTRLGPLELGPLPAGEWRELTSAEVSALRAAANVHQ